MSSRKASIPMQEISESELLALIAKCDGDGIPVYVQTAIDCTNRRIVARLFDTGKISYTESHFGKVVHLA